MNAASGALLDRVERGLRSDWAPWLVGVLTGALIWWLLGTINPLPWVYDEAAYLLQAKIFATFHWSVAGPPLPEFFEQPHVFVTPSLVPKYPPGHALLMVPGIWAGASALMPLLFSAATGALVFGLSRALANGWVALVTWAIWITAPVELYIRPSYLSQSSTTLMWLVAWWAIDQWGRGRGDRWLTMAATAMAAAVITRPITALALGLPVVVAVLVTSAKRRRWAPLIRAAGAAIPVLALAPLWSYQASGRAFPTPYSEYSRVYVPWNMPGFTIDRTPPIRAEIPAITKFRTEWLPIHEGHLPRRLPRIAWERFVGIGVTFFGDGGLSARSIPPLRYLLLVGFLVGLFSLPRSVGLAAVGAPVLFLTMLWLASRPLWTVYYLEVFPVVALATGLGCWRLARWSCERWNKPRLEPRLLVTIGLVVAAPGTVDRLIRAKQQQEDVRFVSTELHRAVATIPGRVVVFIEPGPAHRPYESYAENWPDPAAARVWLVHDRGADNARLLSLAPDRTPYLFDPGSGRLRPLGER